MIGNSGGIHRTRRKVILLPRKWIIGFVALVAVFAGALGVASVAQATSGSPHKVTICHRTDSETNPYVKIPVDSASVDGNVGNDHGKGDHYAEHKGTVWFPGHTKEPKWGDIIPPFYSNGTPDGLPSLNWSTAGQAIFYNDCKPVTIPPTTTTTTTHTTPPPTTTTTHTTPPPTTTTTTTTHTTPPVTTTTHTTPPVTTKATTPPKPGLVSSDDGKVGGNNGLLIFFSILCFLAATGAFGPLVLRRIRTSKISNR